MHRCNLYVIAPVITSPQAPCDPCPCKNADTCYPAGGKCDFQWEYASGFCRKKSVKGKNQLQIKALPSKDQR